MSLFDAFGFLSDAKLGVEEACDARGVGALNRGETGPIEFEVYYRERGNGPITYGSPLKQTNLNDRVLRERLRWSAIFIFMVE